jgi:ketosteroid isomerase-like protein
VELVRLSTNAVNARDLNTAMQLYAPQVVVDVSRTVGIPVEGRDALRSLLEDWLAGYDELEYSWEEMVDLGDGVVFAIVLRSARPVGTTGYVSNREGWVSVLDNGLCVRLVVYPRTEIDEARAAAERLTKERAMADEGATTDLAARLSELREAGSAVSEARRRQ